MITSLRSGDARRWRSRAPPAPRWRLRARPARLRARDASSSLAAQPAAPGCDRKAQSSSPPSVLKTGPAHRADRAGSRTPKAPRSGARRNRFCRALAINRRALACSLRSAKSAGPRILGPARSARYDGRSEAREEGGRSGVCRACETPPGLLRAGRCCRRRSIAVGPAAARPDQAEGLAAFVIEEIGVDRRGEARIVELDREVIAALAGALR